MSNHAFRAVRLENAGAVVTGSARGIGRAIATRLAMEGARVIIADLDEASAVQTARALRDSRHCAEALGVDVTSPDSVSAMIAAAYTVLRARVRLTTAVCRLASICSMVMVYRSSIVSASIASRPDAGDLARVAEL